MTDWREVYEENRAVPPHSQTFRQSDSKRRSQGFQIVFKHVDGVSIFPVGYDSYELTLTFHSSVS